MQKKHFRILTPVLLILTLLVLLLIRQANLPAPSPAQTPSPAPTHAPSPSPAPATQSPAPSPSPSPSPTAAPLVSSEFELPVQGAGGYTSIAMNLRASADSSSKLIARLDAGTPFRILEQSGAWWRVRTATGAGGWLAHKYCLINLPDIIPSIVYDSTNTYSSKVVSSGKAIPGITGKGLYTGKVQNDRLGTRQFIMPVLYSMARKVYAAQQLALQNGETLILYEAYRPYDVQMTIVRALKQLAQRDETVNSGLSAAPWALSWFASVNLSNHQRGCAVDVSLAKVTGSEPARCGDYAYTRTTGIRRYEMPTPIHELSSAAAAFTGPVSAKSRTAWRQARPAPSMNADALRLQDYCTRAGLTPLASEWWHFNDLDAAESTASNPSTGRYTLSTCLSQAP
jgi:D-alanyl-D-alanine dipeptidase